MRQFFFLLFIFISSVSFSQSDVRTKINLERQGLSFLDEKTLEKSREFIREDTSFYVGYMYMGAFQFYRAADKKGFSDDISFLQKAFDLIEKDYDKELRTRTNDLFTYLRVNNYQADYTNIAYYLQQSYQNIERPDKAFEVLQHVVNRNIQMEEGIESYNTMAWIYHRNRMYKPSDGKKYAFLKNSVKENDSIAFLYLDSALLKIRNDAPMNAGLYDATYLNRQYLFTYHYKAILFDFNLEIDSANYYYDELIRTGYYSSNNYAEFKMAMGEFETADEFFHEAEGREGSDEKRTKEFFYMRGTLDEYRGHPEQADTLLSALVEKQVATPGYGWHSIALARAKHYEGLTFESQKRTNTASNFDELHIATTWGDQQYKLACATLNYTNAVQFKKEFLLENDQWSFWFNPENWMKLARYEKNINLSKLELETLIAEDPERAQVIYTLFSSENLINFDEVGSVVNGFGNDFFIKIYKKLEETDKRPKIKKYFRYMIGKQYLSEGDNATAINYFQQVINDPEIFDPYNTLLYARCCEGMALASSNAQEKDYWTQKMYAVYPQLVPFSDLKMKFNLQVTGVKPGDELIGGIIGLGWIFRIVGLFLTIGAFVYNLFKRKRWHYTIILLPFAICFLLGLYGDHFDRERTIEMNPSQAILNDLKTCSIKFTDDKDVPSVHLDFTEEKDATTVDYYVSLPNTDSTITSGSLRVSTDKLEDGGKLLAYRLFGIKKKDLGEPEEPPVSMVKKDSLDSKIH